MSELSINLHLGDAGRERALLVGPVERGIYWELRYLCSLGDGFVADDLDRIRLGIGVDRADWDRAWPQVAHLFPVVDGRRFHQGTLDALAFKNARRDAGRTGGQASAKQRASNGQAKGQAKGNPPLPLPLPLPDPLPDPSPKPSPVGTDTCPDGGPSGSVGAGDAPVLTLVPSGGSNPEAKKPSKPDSRDAIWKVFKHYWGHGHPSRQPKPTGKTYRAIAARLRDGWIVEELCKSIDGYHLSPFHQGQNDRGVQYLDLELIMRDETKVQHGIEWATNPPKPGNVTSAGRDIRVGHGRAEDVHHTDVTGQVDLGALP